jgi:hypothetical protein
MYNLKQLIQKAINKNCRLQIRFDPEENGEQWRIKFYPQYSDDAHFYSYHQDLDAAARRLLDELEDFNE